ncbi:MAG: DNA translocase FtsK [Sphaerobacteraceae bacterium]|nr:MAG: DNA translocase FtsK [Sphaerobacteraceae bacterium]
MAARATQAKRTSQKTSKKSQSSGTSAASTLSATGRRVTGWFGGVETPDAVRREVAAVLAITGMALIILALYVPGTGSALEILGSGLRSLFGQASFLVPLACIWLAGEALFSTSEGARRRRTIGFVLSSISVVSFFHMIGAPNGYLGGGHFGAGFAEMVKLIVGEIGTGIIMMSVGIVGLYYLTGVDAIGAAKAWRERRAEARAAREAQAAQTPIEAKSRPASPKKLKSGSVDPISGDVIAPEQPANKPVINVPKAAKARKPAKVGSKKDGTAEDLDGTEIPAGPKPLPDIEQLALYEGGTPDQSELQSKAELIEETLENFKVSASVREVHPGPAVTLFTLKPGAGVKVRKITELQNDLALALAAPSIRIEAPVPGMARVGVEIPNETVHTVGLRETIESSDFSNAKAKLPLALGRDVNGSYRVSDLTKMPHLLIAGSTGSGKSVCINGIIATFLATNPPEDLQMVMIDPKMVELVGFNGVPHLKGPVVTEMDKVVSALKMVLREMEDRYQRFSSLGVRNIDGYNLKREDDPSLEKMPYLVVIIDELADLMMTAPDEVETLLVRLAQMARATGIHLLIATQRPSVDVITGLIKANVPARIAFAVTSQTDSRVILDLPGAERLLGKGDMLYLPPDAAKPNRMQGAFIDDKDLQYLVQHWKDLYPDYQYDPAWVELPASDDASSGSDDDLLQKAEAIVKQQGTASASMLQRRLRIGYNRASRLIEQLEESGIVGPSDGPRGRQVYAADDGDLDD